MAKIAPILIITFNRPDYLSQLLDVVQNIESSCIYIYRDGPRRDNKEDKIATEKIVQLIDSRRFRSPIKTNYSAVNNGCGYGPYNAISWAFSQENELIILEDDCIPTPVFFEFCTEMLTKYRNEDNIRLVSGRSNMPEHPIFQNYDYIYSQYAPTLGWATWKRVWNGFDLNMPELKDFLLKKGFYSIYGTKEEAKFMQQRYKIYGKDKKLITHSWDCQFGFYSRRNGALGIVPSKNLVKNIGITGTHPSESSSYIYTMSAESKYSYSRSPQYIAIDKDYDYEFFIKFVYYKYPNIFIRLYNKLRRIYKSLTSVK